ncbi:unnamed protein product [Ectocarpus sp. 13 AM-2016]
MMAGADPNLRDGKAYCPLHLAAEAGHHRLTGVLLRKGAREDAANEFQETPLHLAASKGRALDAVRALLDAGAGVNPKAGENGDCTPLHVAVVDRRMSSICTIRALLEGGSDVNVRNDYDHTPLHVACMCISVSAVELLPRWGADEMLKDDDGSTPADVIGEIGDGDLTDEEIETDHTSAFAECWRALQSTGHGVAAAGWC